MINNYRSALVSTEWLDNNIDSKNLFILDIRESDLYNQGHIKNSVNVPFIVPISDWITMENNLLLELPPEKKIFEVIGNNGISKSSHVIIVTLTPAEGELPYPLANATRVAATLIYSGIEIISILDGGYTKWVNERRDTTDEIPELISKNYEGKVNSNMFVSIDYVKEHIGKSIIIDSRDAEVYSGYVIEKEFADKAGHIPSAISIPALDFWKKDGTYKDINEIKRIVHSKIGKNKNDEIIVYCGVGGYTSTVWYILTQILDYNNVKFFDGSAQEWVKYYDMES